MVQSNTLLITGGAGFIGSWFAKYAINMGHQVIILDKLTYAGNFNNLKEIEGKFVFYHGDIIDAKLIRKIFSSHHPIAIIHFAAESHVDNSISSPADFINTNIIGTFTLLQESLVFFNNLREKSLFKFINVSTDEVYGSLSDSAPPFNIDSKYNPNSPYAASKASADHLARAWYKTYGLPVITTYCSNNFGPFQHQEKLIPKTIYAALHNSQIQIYGKGVNIRDWIYVEDHVYGIYKVLQYGNAGQKYIFSGNHEITNIEIVDTICTLLNTIYPSPSGEKYHNLITFVKDRLGHDIRYAVDSTDTEKSIGKFRRHDFTQALHDTVKWYVKNIII